jgi:hypothetical protein
MKTLLKNLQMNYMRMNLQVLQVGKVGKNFLKKKHCNQIIQLHLRLRRCVRKPLLIEDLRWKNSMKYLKRLLQMHNN